MFCPTSLVLISVHAVVQSANPSAIDAQQAAPADEQQSPAPPAKPPEMIVTGTLEEAGVPHVPVNYPASRDVLDPEQVRRTGARDLNDLIQYVPAVSTRPYNGGDASAPSFSMRGMPDDGLTEYILVLVDGVPSSPMPYGWTAYSFFPLITEQVYAIDMIRGGQAVRYSPNNVAGALNLITPPIPVDEAYEFRTTVGSNDYTSTLFSVGDDNGKFGYLVTLGDRRGAGYRDDGDFEYQTIDSKLRWTYGAHDWLAMRLSYIENEHQAPGGLQLAEYDQDRFQNTRPNNHFTGFRAVTDVVRHVGDEREYVEYFGWVSQTRRTLERQDPAFGAATGTRTTDDDAFNINAGVRGTQEFDALGLDHSLYWGVRASEELLPNRTTKTMPLPSGPVSTISDIEYEMSALSAHVDDTVVLMEDLTLVAGLRAEWVPTMDGDDHITGQTEDDTFFDVLPAAGASYALSDSFALFANYQQSFRAPQVFGLDTTIANPAQDLDFEDGYSWEAGLRAQNESGLSGSVAAWHTNFEDVAFFNAAGLYDNVGDIESDGVDVVAAFEFGALTQVLDGFSIQGSVTWQDSELVHAANPAFDGNETPYAWETKGAWSLQYETESAWRFVLGGVHVGESYSDEANTEAESANGTLGRNPSRTVWDAQVRHDTQWGQKARVRFAVGATNVFDEEWFVHSRGGFFGGGKVAGPPRQLYAGLQVSL